jgi:hypothetical protein
MKRITIIALALLVLLGQTIRAQEEKDFRFTIKTNPLAALGGPFWVLIVPVTGEYKILFETRTAKKQSIETGISYLGPSVLLNIDELSGNDSVQGVNVSGFRVQLAYKFFLTRDKPAPEGFYVGPHISYAKASVKDRENSTDKFNATKVNFDVLLGYQLITAGGFTLNIYTGLGVKMRDYSFSDDSTFDFDYGNKVTPNVPFGFTFGYAF